VKLGLEKFVKAVLYAYPLLETVEKDYDEHIYNKAILSYKSERSAEVLAEYILGEIVEKNRLVWLKALVQRVLNGLSETERAFISAKYFRKQNAGLENKKNGESEVSESTYFRLQQRLGNKVGERFVANGLSKEVFDSDFSQMTIFKELLARLSKQEQRRTRRTE
jgi:hypothetical protein